MLSLCQPRLSLERHEPEGARRLPRFKHLARPVGLALLALSALGTSRVSWAGPRVGELVGTPSPFTTTVQAKVVSATPVVGQIAVPRQVCFDETHQEPARSSGAGAIMGAIAGGAIGNAVGRGSGKALATGLGIFGGAIAGDHVENDGRQGRISTTRRCEQRSSYENRVVAYNVTYEYGGQRYTTQMPREPGPTIALQVTLNPVVQDADPNQLDDNTYPEEASEDDDMPPPPPRHFRQRRWD